MTEEIRRKKDLKVWYRKNQKMVQLLLFFVFIALITLMMRLIIVETDFFDIKYHEIYKYDNSQFQYVDKDELELFVKDNVSKFNYFSLDVNLLEKNIKNSDKFIDEVFAEKVFPAGVLVNITEKQPYITYQSSEGCILIDDKNRFVIQFENESECKVINTLYNTILIKEVENYEIYNESDQEIRLFELFVKIINALRSENITPLEITLKEGEAVITDVGERRYIFNQDDDVNIQVKRFLLVMGQISFDKIEYKELDFRYDRPVLRK